MATKGGTVRTARRSAAHGHGSVDAAAAALLADVPCGAVVLDPHGRIRFWNEEAERMLGWPSAEATGQDPAELMFVDGEHGEAHRAFTEVRRGGRPWRGHVPLRRRDGGLPMFDLRMRPQHDGRVVATFSELPEQPSTTHGSELESIRDRLAFVVHAGSRLASSLDVAMTLETLGDLVIPRFARLCIVDLWNGRTLERVYVHEFGDGPHSPGVKSLSGQQQNTHPAMRAARTGQSVVIPTTDPEVAARMYDDPLAREIVQDAAGGEAFAAVPLVTRGRVVGVLTLLGRNRAGVPPLTDTSDLRLAEQVANHAAQSIENARLFDAQRQLAKTLAESEHQQRQAARTLQRSLLPTSMHQPDELEIAARYFPGTEDTEVGGDWYDVIPLGPARTALVIGDVMGRGLRAASFMGQVRTAIRAYARQDLPPAKILELVDGVVADLGEAEIVTCIYAVFDSEAETLTYASAGHLPLLLSEPSGRTYRLNNESGLPLGVATCGAPEHVVATVPGTLAAFYTDGLVEHRERDMDSGVDELVEVLRANAAHQAAVPETLCDTLIEAMRPAEDYDDVALLLVRTRRRTEEPSQTMSTAVPPDLSAAPYARSKVEEALYRWGVDGDLRANIVLTTAELVANALRHGGAPIQLRVQLRRDVIAVEVDDGSPRPPVPVDPEPTDEFGRGLRVVQALSDDWGWRPARTGKVVWAEHHLPTDRR